MFDVTSKVRLSVLDKNRSKKLLFDLDMLPEKSYQIFN